MTYIDQIKAKAARYYKVSIEDIEVIEDIDGYGIHVHDSTCRPHCGKHFDNSDRIVTIRYNKQGHQAVYGVLNDEITLWMD